MEQKRFDKRNLAVLLAIVYAFSVRTILASILFRTTIQIALFYILIYILLGVNLVNDFNKIGNHLYAPHGFYSVLLVSLVIIVSLISCGHGSAGISYGIALLLPFSITSNTKDSNGILKLIVGFSVFYAIGCILNFIMPSAFKSIVFPLFSESSQGMLEDFWSRNGEYSYFAGFANQIGYASYFINIGIGVLFCYRNSVLKKAYIPLIITLAFGLFLTGKRGPIFFAIITIAVIYLIEDYSKFKLYRILKISAILLLGYLLLLVGAKIANIDGIDRILRTVNQLFESGRVEDLGRKQLRDQAIEYFKQNPFLGIGWENYKYLFTLRRTHVHCIYYQLLCESGIVGFSIFVLFFFANLKRSIKALNISRRNDDINSINWYKLSVFIQVYFLLYGTTGNPLYDVEELIVYFFAVGISFVPIKREEN